MNEDGVAADTGGWWWQVSGTTRCGEACLQGENEGTVMDRNFGEPMRLQDPDPTCQCADCRGELPVELVEEMAEVA